MPKLEVPRVFFVIVELLAERVYPRSKPSFDFHVFRFVNFEMCKKGIVHESSLCREK